MGLGHARVSTNEQNLDLQLDAMKRAGCDQVFLEVITGKSRKRPDLDGHMAATKRATRL